MCDRSEKSFDCVEMMRQIRDRISREIEHMDHDELQAWLARFSKLYTQKRKDS